MTGYDAGGLDTPQDLTLDKFGKAQNPACGWLVQLQGTKFVPTPSNGEPSCGSPIPNSDQLHG
jgi:hypothetical protein